MDIVIRRDGPLELIFSGMLYRICPSLMSSLLYEDMYTCIVNIFYELYVVFRRNNIY